MKRARYASHRLCLDRYWLPMPLCCIELDGKLELLQLEGEGEAISFLPGSLVLLPSCQAFKPAAAPKEMLALSLDEMKSLIQSYRSGSYTLWHSTAGSRQAKALAQILIP